MALLRVLGVISCFQSVIAISRTAMSAILDGSLSDDEKEGVARTSSIRLFALFLKISAVIVIALGAPLAGIWILDAFGLQLLSGVLSALASWPFVVGAVVVGAVVFLVGRSKST